MHPCTAPEIQAALAFDLDLLSPWQRGGDRPSPWLGSRP
jgi:hypothetical protein